MKWSSFAYLSLVAGIRLILTVHHVVLDVKDWQHAGDIPFYYQLATLSDSGYLPFIHFWTEYPPLFPFLITGFYQLVSLFGLGQPEGFTYAVQVFLYGVEVANLFLIYGLVNDTQGDRAARIATALYAVCPMLVFFGSGWFDPLASLFALSAIYALNRKRPATAGILIGIGILTKIYPGVLILAAPAALGLRHTGRLLVATAATLGVVVVPLAIAQLDLLIASFGSMATRPAWETVSALLSGNYAWGVQPDLGDRFTAASAWAHSDASPLLTLLPETVLALGVAGAWLALKRERSGPREMYAVAALAVTSFALGNKGFSPQFVVWFAPFILLAWPNRVGIAYLALFSVHFFVYDRIVFPTMSAYFEQGQGTFEAMSQVVWASVLTRTLLLAGVTIHLYTVVAGPLRWPVTGLGRIGRMAPAPTS